MDQQIIVVLKMIIIHIRVYQHLMMIELVYMIQVIVIMSVMITMILLSTIFLITNIQHFKINLMMLKKEKDKKQTKCYVEVLKQEGVLAQLVLIN